MWCSIRTLVDTKDTPHIRTNMSAAICISHKAGLCEARPEGALSVFSVMF